MHHILDLIYDPNNDDEKRRAQALMRELTWERCVLVLALSRFPHPTEAYTPLPAPSSATASTGRTTS